VIDQDPTIELYKDLKSPDLVTYKKWIVPKDSVNNCIKRLKISKGSGIGFVIIYECFDKDEQTISAFYTFFDIGTRQILRSDYFISHDGNSYHRVTDWGDAAIIAMKKYVKFLQKENVK